MHITFRRLPHLETEVYEAMIKHLPVTKKNTISHIYKLFPLQVFKELRHCLDIYIKCFRDFFAFGINLRFQIAERFQIARFKVLLVGEIVALSETR